MLKTIRYWNAKTLLQNCAALGGLYMLVFMLVFLAYTFGILPIDLFLKHISFTQMLYLIAAGAGCLWFFYDRCPFIIKRRY
jgi:hypothetical protein